MSAVVVGIDRSPNSRAAFRWAAAEARARSWPLTAIHAAPRPLADTGFGVDLSAADAERQQAAEQLLDETLTQVGAALNGVDVRCLVPRGTAAHLLLEAVEPDDLLVVGTRGTEGFAGLLLGSTAEHCARHARCPVVVVPPGHRTDIATILVGVDGSDAARRALRWALGAAAHRGASVEVMSSYLPYHPGVPFGADYMAIASPGADRRFTDAAERLASTAVEEVDVPEGVEVRTTVGVGQAAQVLIERSSDVDLVVLGSRGLGGFAELLLGSVSRQVLHHAACPVTVVR